MSAGAPLRRSPTGQVRGRMRHCLAVWLARLLVPVLVAACSPEIPSGPEIPPGVKFLELTGSWLYTASEVQRAGSTGGAPCEITGVVLELEKIKGAGAFSGKSAGGNLTCAGELAFLSGPLASYSILEGYAFNEFISFDFGSPDWRHDGLVVSTDSTTIDSMSGKFTLRNAGVVFEGKFRAVRRAG